MPTCRQTCKHIYLTIVQIMCIMLLSGFVHIHPSYAETSSENKRPKIGLALSGGGARGLAHIGVLKRLEQLNVPVDYIAGTSMGSIIGGMYAMGMTADEIEQLILNMDWENEFNDYTSRNFRTFRRKNDDRRLHNTHRIGIKNDGFNFPPGLIEGQHISITLEDITLRATQLDDFDKLAIPYRAVATDITNGEAVVLKSGNLARAMLASMSVPGGLPPVESDGQLLVDGGIADNIPIDVVREMGADIVIAIDISTPLTEREKLTSALAITGQLSGILTRRNADKQIATLTDYDTFIKPDLEEYSSASFSEQVEIIQRGYEAAIEATAKLERYALSESDFKQHKAALPVLNDEPPIIEFIEINNNSGLRDEVFLVKLHQVIGEPLDFPQLDNDIATIYGLDIFESVNYSIDQKDGKTGLVLNVTSRRWAPQYLQFGLSLETDFERDALTNIDVLFTKPEVNDIGGEFRAGLTVGNEPAVLLEFYQPLDVAMNYFVHAQTGFDSEIYYQRGNNIDFSKARFDRKYINLAVGRTFSTTSEFRLGFDFAAGESRTLIGPTLNSEQNFDEGGYFFRYRYDSLDNVSFPRKGVSGEASYAADRVSMGSDSNYEQASLQYLGVTTFNRFSFLGRLRYDTTIDDDAPFNALFRRGGFLDLSGTLNDELIGQHWGIANVIAYRKLGDILFLPS